MIYLCGMENQERLIETIATHRAVESLRLRYKVKPVDIEILLAGALLEDVRGFFFDIPLIHRLRRFGTIPTVYNSINMWLKLGCVATAVKKRNSINVHNGIENKATLFSISFEGRKLLKQYHETYEREKLAIIKQLD